MKLIHKIAFCIVLSIFIGVNQSFSQKWKSEVYEYTKEFLNSYDPHKSCEREIMLVGTFHYRSKELSADAVKDQIIDFGPAVIFVEEVPPSDESGYKEAYKNELYENPKRGARFYSIAVDSMVSYTGISREESEQVIKTNYALLTENPENVDARVELINALFINGDDHNAVLQMEYLKQVLENIPDKSFDSVKSGISPTSFNYRFSMGETRCLSVPIAVQMGHTELYGMDYQKDRVETDSILSIVSKKMIAKLIWKVWKIPYMMKMMGLNNRLPKDDTDADRFHKILNKPKTIKNMAKVQEVYLYSKKSEASKIWIDLYRKRNREMISMVKKAVEEQNFNSVAIVVGAGHVPHFLYEIDKQIPGFCVYLLDTNRL